MRLYRTLSRVPFLSSYTGKIFFITFVATHIPLLSAACYVTLSTMPLDRALPILGVILLATLIGTAGALWALHALLAPLRATTDALRRYTEDHDVPDLPTTFSDRAGMLMRDTQAALAQLDALLQFKTRMLGVISHDARGPATSILMAAGTISNQLDQADPNVELVRSLSERVEEAVQYQLDIVDSISELARHGEGRLTLEKERGRLGAIVDATADLLRTHAERRNHTLSVTVDQPDLTLHTDLRKLEQVLSNLLSNAIKYTPKGGQVAIRTTVDAGTVTFRVSDTGNGIPDSVRHELFDAYSAEASPDVDSVGLGLWICRTFTQAMGGEIEVEDTSGDGTTFRVTFPREAVVPDGSASVYSPDAAVGNDNGADS